MYLFRAENAAAKYKDELTDVLLKLYSTHKLPKQRKAICACLYKFDSIHQLHSTIKKKHLLYPLFKKYMYYHLSSSFLSVQFFLK